MENTKLTEEKNQALFSVVCHLLETIVNVASLLENCKPWVVNVPSLFLIGCIRFSDALGKFIKSIHQPVQLLLSRLDNVLHGLVDTETGKQHGSVGRCSHDAHLLKARQAVVSVKAGGAQLLCKLRGFHFWARAEDHDGANLSLVQSRFKEQFVPHHASPRTCEMSARIRATWRRGRNSQS